MMRLRLVVLLALLVFAFAALAATCTPPPPASTGTCAGASVPAHYAHVVIVVMENKTYGQVIGNGSAPWQTGLAHACGTATHYASVGSPSRPNYIGMTAGATFGCAGSDADPPGGCTPTSPSLFKQVLDHGGTVRSYAESMSGNCALRSSGSYAVKHNPWPYFAAERGICGQYDQPLPNLNVNALPTLTYIAPNLCNDTHDCGVSTGDNWLKAHVQPILNSSAYASGNTAVIVVYDEYTNLPNVFAAKSIRAGTVVTASTNHYGLLRTVEDLLGVAHLGYANTNASLRSPLHL